MLGPAGLAELEANLWPVDCQTCGGTLGPTRPAVYVIDLIDQAYASLHHPRCRRPEWSTSPQISFASHLSWTSQTFLLPGMAGTRRDDRPLLVVNPGLEQVPLHRNADGKWRVGTVEFFRRLGLRTPGRDLFMDRSIPGVTARRDGNTLTVGFDDVPTRWSGDASGRIGDRIRELAGVMLCITTAANPSDIEGFDQLSSLIASGQLTMGWIALHGVQPRTPPRPDS